MTYSAFRTNGLPTLYGDNKQPVTVDVLITGLIFAFLIVAFTFYIVIPGIRGNEKIYVFIRVTISLFVGAAILLCNFGQEWEVGKVKTETQYKAFSKKDVKAEIGLKIGLRSINVTLVGKPIHQLGETIQYNERFSWQWAQGKNGFGSQAGRINREFRAAQFKGLPYPILWVAEYFTIDGEGIRFGRNYRTAGWYCHILLWTAFPLWLLSNILFFMVIRYGAYYLSLTGACMVMANIIFVSIRNHIPLVIPMGTEKISLHYGWSFWLNLLTGIACIILGFVILFLDLRYPEEISSFFSLDVLKDYEDFYADPGALDIKITPKINLSEPSPSTTQGKEKSEELYGMRKRTLSIRFQRGSFRVPTPTPRKGISEELPVYENLGLQRFDTIDEGSNEYVNDHREEILMQPLRR